MKGYVDERPLIREFLQNKITVATVHGRQYYKIINALKSMDLEYESLPPEQAATSNAKIIITTKDEASIISKKDILLDTEFDKYPVLLKAKIMRLFVSSYQDDQLTIGIDPGSRIGISIIYLDKEIESFVESSPASTIRLLSILLGGIHSKKKIVRIGDGDMAMSTHLANMIKAAFRESVKVEIVDEHGTSLPRYSETNRRGVRDRSSARRIALRSGRAFNPC